MSFSKKIIKNSTRGLKSTALIGICALFSTQLLISNELYAATSVPTSYNISDLSLAMNRQVPAGYVKTNYKVSCSQTPDAKDLSSNDAAEIIAQEIYRLSKKSLTNQTISLEYEPLTPKANSQWIGEVKFDTLHNIRVNIDGSTGQLLYIGQETIIPVANGKNNATQEKEIDRDGGNSLQSLTSDFKKNESAYLEKAKGLIQKSGYITEPIQEVTYSDAKSGSRFENNIVVGKISNYIFNATTNSGKTYKFYLSKDLSCIDQVWTPEFLTYLKNTSSSSYEVKAPDKAN